MIKKMLAMGLLVGAAAAQAFVPQAGTWVVDAETNGQPGRGFGLEVQNSTLVMLVYAYESTGAPTFYLTSGPLLNDQFSGALMQYRNGRYLGSEDRVGVETGSAGTVTMRFVSGTQGFITLPGEPEKAISRFNFASPAGPDGLKGLWLFTPLNSATPTADFVTLETDTGPSETGNGLVISPDGRVGCEHMVAGELAGTVLCIHLTSEGDLDHGYQFVYSVNDGEGIQFDRTVSTSVPAVMRRVGNASYQGTGIYLKSADAKPASEATLQNLRKQFKSFASGVAKR
ncbi:hypothetical protein SDC9_96865 [bioreactor metagenome]|uniref:Uncharacterized protein n=1 Tax=bioreactor metagenome TaxID=1076179 RepID=A0A645AAA5_9ZZZZ